MTHSKKAVALIVFLFLGLAVLILYIFSELYTENPYEEKPSVTTSFKQEYEDLNNENDYIKVDINKETEITYKNEYELIDSMDKNETFIVYFGYKECNWCRSTLNTFTKIASEMNISNIYYVDISDMRDNYELNDNNELVKTVEGTEGYYKLLEKFSSILDDYEALTYKNKKGKTKKVIIEEKRIYAPTYIIVKNGIPTNKITGISEKQENELDKLTDEIKKEQEDIFRTFFNNYNTNQNTCSASEAKC